MLDGAIHLFDLHRNRDSSDGNENGGGDGNENQKKKGERAVREGYEFLFARLRMRHWER